MAMVVRLQEPKKGYKCFAPPPPRQTQLQQKASKMKNEKQIASYHRVRSRRCRRRGRRWPAWMWWARVSSFVGTTGETSRSRPASPPAGEATAYCSVFFVGVTLACCTERVFVCSV